MNNQEILRQIVDYIKSVMDERSLSSRDLAKICAEKAGKMSPRTIDYMFKAPSSTTISTLLKICDGLDLNLTAILHSIEIAKTASEKNQQKLIYDISNPAYYGYTGKYHVFFLSTAANPEECQDKPLTHGILQLGDIYGTNECSAILDLDSGDLTPEGEPFSKHYEGTLVYSSTKMIFCQLACNRCGDMWSLVFDHGDLNNKDLACIVGCAATSSSGRFRYPAIHRFCLCNVEQYPTIDSATQELIQGILRLQNNRIIIKKAHIDEFLNRTDIDPAFKVNLQNHLNIAKDYYSIDKSALTTDLDFSVYTESIAKLCNVSELERTYHIRHNDDRMLSSILKNPHS